MCLETKAIEYCEKHGVIDYKITPTKLIYYANYPAYLYEKRRTYKVTIDLSTMQEKRTLLKKWNAKGNSNMYK